MLGQRVAPLRRVGIYVPGGRAAYPSSVLMNAIPASVAGVDEIAMVTPTPGGEVLPVVLAAAHVAGVTEVLRIGGAQAVGALAYGTETIGRVDKIVGPGNKWVAEAKRQVFGTVDIDMVAGPSEILVIADESADPVHVAADLIGQAEHDPDAISWLVTTSAELAARVPGEIDRLLERNPRRDVARAALEANGAIVIVDSLEDAAAVADLRAPEHLELLVARAAAAGGAHPQRGRDLSGRQQPGADGRLLRGPQPRAAHGRHGAVRQPAGRVRLRQAHQPDRPVRPPACAATPPTSSAWPSPRACSGTRRRCGYGFERQCGKCVVLSSAECCAFARTLALSHSRTLGTLLHY